MDQNVGGRVLSINTQFNTAEEKGDSKVKEVYLWTSNLNREIGGEVEVISDVIDLAGDGVVPWKTQRSPFEELPRKDPINRANFDAYKELITKVYSKSSTEMFYDRLDISLSFLIFFCIVCILSTLFSVNQSLVALLIL